MSGGLYGVGKSPGSVDWAASLAVTQIENETESGASLANECYPGFRPKPHWRGRQHVCFVPAERAKF